MLKFKNDIPAGLVVFLVALPLCLGVALASGAPLISGIISGIIGGIIVGALSGSQSSVSGPAAGLAAVVLTSITELGTFNIFLLAVIISGIIQLLLGILKMGIIADYIPSSIIKGLLAAIGIILILKQIPHGLGYDADPEGDFAFHQTDGANTFSEFTHLIGHISIGATLITAISLLVLVYWSSTSLKKIKLLPASLLVAILGIVLNAIFIHFFPSLQISEKHLVQIPPFDFANMSAMLQFPDIDHAFNPKVWQVGVTVAIVASLETLLNIEAVDNIDPHKRNSPPNRELIAQGVGNIFAGFIGGIPITSVIVRSSVNIDAGGETKASAITHGVLLLLSVVALGSVMNLIPLASLAAILLVTGYKLANISLFKSMYKEGWTQFIPFMVTIIAIILTDLLIGILIGSAISVFFVMRSIYKNPFSIQNHTIHKNEVIRIELPSQVSFFNKPMIKKSLWGIPEGSKVIIDATETDYIEHDILELINDFKTVTAPERKIRLNIIGLRNKYQYSDHIQFIEVMDKDTQMAMTPKQVLDMLKAGNDRFVNGKWLKKYYNQQTLATSLGQYPIAAIVGCIDSRTSPEILFDSNLGDLLTIRVAGNVVADGVLSSLEIACLKIGAKLIVVKGHEDCGAIKLALHEPYGNNIDLVTDKIKKAIDNCGCGHVHYDASLVDKPTLKKITWGNVHYSIKEILERSPKIKELVRTGQVGIVGAYHDTETGVVNFEELQID